MKYLITVATTLLLLLVISSTADAQEPPSTWSHAQALWQQGAQEWDPRILHGTLANGMQYLYFDTRQEAGYNKSGMSMQLIVHAGASDEDEDQMGVAHMVEHMSFRSSERFQSGARSGFKALGLIQGRSFNAMTNADVTRYMVTLENSKPELFSGALGVLQQMMFHASMKAEDLATERQIILEEWRGGLSSRRAINDQKKDIIRVGSAYAERPVIGTQKSIENTPITKIQRFYNDWYAPNNMTLVVIGAMDNATAKQNIEQAFSQEPSRNLPQRKPKDPELSNTLHLATLTDSESRVNRVAYLFRFPSSQSETLAQRREQLISYLSRKLLTQQIRRQSERTDSIRKLGATKGEASPNVDLIAFGTLYDPGEMQAQLRQMLIEIERLKRYGFYQEDFDATLADARQSAQRNITAAQSRGIFWLAKLAEAGVEQRPLPEPTLNNKLSAALLDTITLDDVNQQVRQWLSTPDQVAYTQKSGNNHTAETFTQAVIAGMQNTIKQMSLEPPFARQSVAKRSLHAATENKPATLLKRFPELGVSHWQLANGEQLWLLDTPQQDDTLYFQAVHDFGYQNTLWDITHSQILAQMMAKQTPPQWSDAEAEQWKDTYNVRGYWDQNTSQNQYRFSGARQDLAAQLAYYQQTQRNNKLSTSLYDGFHDSLERNSNNQVTRVSDQFRKAFTQHQYDAGQLPDTQAQLKQFLSVSRNALSQQIKQIHARPATYFVAAANVEALQPMLARYLGAIPREASTPAIHSAPLTPHLETQRFTLAKARIPRASFRMEGFTPLAWTPQKLALIPHLADEMNARFKAVLRGQIQGIYSLKSDIRYDTEKQGVILSVRFTSDPARIDELEENVQALIQSWSDDLDEKWITQQKAQFIRAEKQRSQRPSTQLNRLQLSLKHYGHPYYLSDAKHLAKGFTLDNLNQLLSELTWPSRTTGILLPKHAAE